MNSDTVDKVVESYSRLKNLKLVGIETGVKWQNVYLILKKAGIAVTGDKSRYGSATDRLAVVGELMFKKAVPFAVDNNDLTYQATIDFSIGSVTIDVKAARLVDTTLRGKKTTPRWAYCISKQKDVADYFVLYALDAEKDDVKFIFLIPKEMATTKTSISIPQTLNSKWSDYMVSSQDLYEFFDAIRGDSKLSA